MSHKKPNEQPNKGFAPAIGPSNKEGDDAPTKKAKKHFWVDWEPMEQFTFIIAFFTIIYSCVTMGLYLVAKDTLVVSQRAFVYAEKADILGAHINTGIVRAPNEPILLLVTFKNSGQTVAKNAGSTIGKLLNKDGIPIGFDFPTASPSTPILIAPSQETHISLPITETDLSDAESGRTLLFVYGEEYYQDVFGTRHRTEYCFQLFGHSIKSNGEFNEWIFYSGPQHNCADDDCQN